MDEKEIDGYIEKVGNLIDKYIAEPRKSQIEKMLEDIGHLYFTAPASSREDFHYAFAGGLVKHSLNVFRNLIKLNKAFELNFETESMLISTLFHDLGKACTTDLDGPHYAPVEEDWKRKKGWLYQKEDGSIYFPNHQRSLYILQKYGVELKPEEYQAILINDGQYIWENSGYKQKESELALFLHMADRIACEFEGKEGQNN